MNGLHGRRGWIRAALLLVTAASLSGAAPSRAAVVDLPDKTFAVVGRGLPIRQVFRADGTSVVTTAGGSVCVASRRIEIAGSSYTGPTGDPIPFAMVTRSPAASVQAIRQMDGRTGFRIQLKYSLRPDAPAWLEVGPAAPTDIASRIEASTDSLWLDGEEAAALVAAGRSGDPIRLTGVSADTGRRVTDMLLLPDLAALQACATTLAPGPAVMPPLAHQVSLAFVASANPATLATPEDIGACNMTPTDRPLHLGRIRETTGFFAQTDKVFVAFDPDGRIEQVYVPGVFDAGLYGRGTGEARVSIAADANTPDAPNAVKGCLGAESLAICHLPAGGGPDGHLLRACETVPGFPAGDPIADASAADPPPVGSDPAPGPRPPWRPPGPPSPDPLPGYDPGDAPPPAPVPLPGGMILLLPALVGLVALRKRRHRR